ncbi:hypothetical protein PRNP1_006835 [Phytophthora ramorum]
MTSWPPFSAAVLVTRECLPAALPHVTLIISDFLDALGREGVFAAAIRRGDSERELSYLFKRDPTPLSQHMSVRPKDEMQWFGWAFNSATDNGHVIVAEWVYTTYHEHLSESVLALALSAAIDNGHDAMAQWLFVQQSELR